MIIKKTKIFLMIILTLLLSSCSLSEFVISDTLDEPIIHNVYNFKDKPTTDVLSISNSIGDIKITKSNTDDLKVAVNLVQTKNLKDIDEKLSNLLIKPKIENGVIFYEPLYKSNEQMNFWEWIHINLNANGIKMTFDIEIPSTIKELRVYNSLGNIDLQDVNAKIYAQTDIGHISGKNLDPIDSAIFKVDVAFDKLFTDSEFKVKDIFNDTAGINVSFSNISNTNNITTSTDTGKTILSLPSGSKYTHKYADIKDISSEYPFEPDSKEYFKYCREQSLKPITPKAEKLNETVINTATDNNPEDVSIETN